jgi:competence protein ComEA
MNVAQQSIAVAFISVTIFPPHRHAVDALAQQGGVSHPEDDAGSVLALADPRGEYRVNFRGFPMSIKSALAIVALVASSAFAVAQTTQQTQPQRPAAPTAPAQPAAPRAAQPAPAPAPAAAQPAQRPAAGATSQLVNLNTAPESELDKLPQIGEARAKAIIAKRPYRDWNDFVAKNVVPANAEAAIKDKVRFR